MGRSSHSGPPPAQRITLHEITGEGPVEGEVGCGKMLEPGKTGQRLIPGLTRRQGQENLRGLTLNRHSGKYEGTAIECLGLGGIAIDGQRQGLYQATESQTRPTAFPPP